MGFLRVAPAFTVHHNKKGLFSRFISPLLYQNRVNCITSDTVFYSELSRTRIFVI